MARPGPSILNMAEAMLAAEYRTSHNDLKQECDQIEKTDAQNGDNKRKSDEVSGSDEDPQQGQQLHMRDVSKTVQKSVVITVPPKRRKISNACNFNAGDVVQGLCRLPCFIT
jgi:hypothetical protein